MYTFMYMSYGSVKEWFMIHVCTVILYVLIK